MAKETKFGSHQGHVNEDHRSIGIPNEAEWQDLYAAIDARLTFPAQILASDPEDDIISIFQTEVTLADGRRIVMPPNKGELPSLSAIATISPVTNATTGSVETIPWPAAAAADQYVRMGLILLSAGTIRAVFNAPGATLGGDGSVPFTEDDINIGYVDLVSIGAGTFYKGASAVSNIVTMDDIVQFSGTQSLTTSSQGAAVISPADGFRAIVFDEFFKDPSDEFSKVDKDLTTAEYRNGAKLYQMQCDKSKTVTVVVNTTGQNEVQQLQFSGQATSGSYQLDFDGEVTGLIAGNATAADIEAALEALPNISDVEVSTTDGLTFTITFKGEWVDQDVPELVIVNNTVTITGDSALGTYELDRWTFAYGDLHGDAAPGIAGMQIVPSTSGSVTLGDQSVTIGNGSGYSTLQYTIYGRTSVFSSGWSVRFKFTPTYNGSVPNNITLFSISMGSGAQGFRVRSQSGSIVLERGTTSFGSITHTANFAYSSFVAGVPVEFEISTTPDSGTRVCRLFFNGVQQASISDGAAPFGVQGTSTVMIFGSTSAAAFSDIQLFNTTVHTSNFTGEIPRTVNTFIGPNTDGWSSFKSFRATYSDNDFYDASGNTVALLASDANTTFSGGRLNLNGSGGAANIMYSMTSANMLIMMLEWDMIPGFTGSYPSNSSVVEFGSMSGGAGTHGIRIRNNAGTIFVERISAGSVAASASFAHAFTSGVSQRWLLVTDGAPSGIRLYVDSVLKATVSGNVANNPASPDLNFLATNADYSLDNLLYTQSATATDPTIWPATKFIRSLVGTVTLNVSTVSGGVAGDVDYTLSAAPSFTMKVNDILWVDTEWRRVIQVDSTTTGKLDAPFSGPVTAQACMVSQALYTKDLVNVAGNASQQVRVRDFFPDARIGVCHVEYIDSRAADDAFGDFSEEANVVVAASNQGGRLDVSFPLASSFAPPFVRSQLPDQELDYPLILEEPDVDDCERLFLVFFPNPNNASVTSLANALEFECSLIEKETFAASGIRDTAFAMSVTGTPNNSQAPDNSGTYTVWEVDFDSNLRANPSGTQGETLFFVDGYLLPRRKDGVTMDAYWEPVAGSNRAIMLNANIGSTNLSMEAIRMHGSYDTSDANGMKLAALYDAVVGSPSQVESGIATHSDLQVAYDYVWDSAGGGRILLLGDHGGSLTLTHSEIAIEGRGRKSQISGAVSISGNNNIIEKVRIVGNLTLTGNRNFVTNVYLAPAFSLSNTGVDNVFLIVQEP